MPFDSPDLPLDRRAAPRTEASRKSDCSRCNLEAVSRGACTSRAPARHRTTLHDIARQEARGIDGYTRKRRQLQDPTPKTASTPGAGGAGNAGDRNTVPGAFGSRNRRRLPGPIAQKKRVHDQADAQRNRPCWLDGAGNNGNRRRGWFHRALDTMILCCQFGLFWRVHRVRPVNLGSRYPPGWKFPSMIRSFGGFPPVHGTGGTRGVAYHDAPLRPAVTDRPP